MDKQELRRQVLEQRRHRSAAEIRAAGSALRDTLVALPELTMGGTVAVYYSVGEEPDTRKLVTALWRHGVYVLLPVFQKDRNLDWAAYEGPDSVEPSRLGLLEPTGPRYGLDAPYRAAAVICPALAVDTAGRRLGRGAGCYDRALARVGPNTRTLAVVYDTEVVATVPAEPHDIPVQGVVTPQAGLRWFPHARDGGGSGTDPDGTR
ncbi:5-formyltetrahydrofolate cyclo-ligase [Lipingzhangella sp. LS1_29]|uniref:5-formyltetrahydrofolate cyclo-ligase n=1 Tax=Lipingzhangella rawalii TaxID=2055835 RepID=A0ABU2H5R2_9ACTN|nr:5-formyltetrahydrofolate cyclo-ligase [Lipingzhangella rawalii]MDS1270347.1 5-formyltetrahydrofolate cyclo-ligase [Lipingzhangella rawalii]